MFESIILPGIVALLVSLLTFHLKERHTDRSQEFKDYTKLCSNLRSSIIKSNPAMAETDFICHAKDMLFMIDNSEYFDEDKKKFIHEMINTLEYQFAYITIADIDKETLEENKSTAITSVNNISIEIRKNQKISLKRFLPKLW